MENKQVNQNQEPKEQPKPPVETIVVTGVKPFGADAPMPTDRNEIKRQLGFKR